MLTIEQIREVVRQELLGKGVSAEFRELVAVEGGDSFLPCEDSVPEEMYSQHEELEKLTRGEPLMKSAGIVNTGWDEQVSTPLVKRANVPQDGSVIEKCGTQTWKYHYQSGQCWRMELEDPEVAGGRMFFDGEGNELAA